MVGYLFRLMKTACKNRLSEGKTWDEIRKIYSKLTDDEFKEIKAAVESEENNERN
jgi:hypothetical protein